MRVFSAQSPSFYMTFPFPNKEWMNEDKWGKKRMQKLLRKSEFDVMRNQHHKLRLLMRLFYVPIIIMTSLQGIPSGILPRTHLSQVLHFWEIYQINIICFVCAFIFTRFSTLLFVPNPDDDFFKPTIILGLQTMKKNSGYCTILQHW